MIDRLRDAIGFCKVERGVNTINANLLTDEDKVQFERCLIQNYLIPYGMDYFGKRQLIYLDMYDSRNVKSYTTNNLDTQFVPQIDKQMAENDE